MQKQTNRIQIPPDKAELLLYACAHFDDNNTEEVFAKSIYKFISDHLSTINPDLYKKCRKYLPSQQSLYRAIGKREPGYIQQRNNIYLPQILDCYIKRFENEFPEQYVLFKEKMTRHNESIPKHANDRTGDNKLFDFEDYINFKSSDFTGRQWFFDKLFSLVHTGRAEKFFQSAYLLIHGDPGIGKTAIMAQLAKKYGYVHHFNIQNEGINTTSLFLDNICAQLIHKYHLGDHFAIRASTTNSIFLQQVLKAVSKKIEAGDEPCIILVDAIDEVKYTPGETANSLFLPDTLPGNIFFILSSREPGQLKLPSGNRFETLPIIGASRENMDDAKEYLEFLISKEAVQSYLRRHKTDHREFLSTLLERSEGNFIYLYHIIREISIGIYSSTSLKELPKGLEQYYEEHWRIIRGDDGRRWIDFRLPVLAILAVAELPVDVKFISRHSDMKSTADIIEALTVWSPFLHKHDGKYSLYHKSFRDFLLQKDQVKGEALDLKVTRAGMISKMKKDLR